MFKICTMFLKILDICLQQPIWLLGWSRYMLTLGLEKTWMILKTLNWLLKRMENGWNSTKRSLLEMSLMVVTGILLGKYTFLMSVMILNVTCISRFMVVSAVETIYILFRISLICFKEQNYSCLSWFILLGSIQGPII